MDFFESQARAHRKTRWLLVYFVLAVLGIIATLQGLAAFAMHEALTDMGLLGMVSAGVIVVVALGALYRIAELSRGGGVVAEMLGGRQIAPHTTDLREVQLRNVVEEMALASGVPVPDIYVLDDERAINAFAAGNTAGDAVVAVTRGTLDQLNRDQLQGVVAHEFSHILNGDMRLNLRLMGVLNGILLLAILGRIVFEIGARFGGSARSDRDGKNAQIPIFAIGAALWLVGSVGVFFAKLIKAAVSRQREFLADASAVQFTRNPDGIAGALWKIGKEGSRLQSARADEASHLFFGNGLGESFLALFATHPPLDERIRAIAPGFDPARLAASPPSIEAATRPALNNLATVGAMLAALPAFVREGARETASAVPLIYALLLSRDAATRERQLAGIELNDAERAEVARDLGRSGEITDALAMMDLCLPALRKLSEPQYRAFRENVRRLIACDGEVDLFEFVLHQALVRHVDHFFTKSVGPIVRYRSPLPLLPDIATVLSALAWFSDGESAARDAAFSAGVAALLLKPDAFPMRRAEACDFPAVEAALERMAEADPATKRKILNACAAAVRHDGVIHPREAALLRAVADVLGCPLPA
ncbi:MAG: M48 family metallopeptidase [Terrimicrobiaceae bacterium]|nr:M48 family metallopeptidase [Terrimicrobiaceae bacterium]